jgi:hypothetical protein
MKQGIGAAVAAVAMMLLAAGAATAHTTEYESVAVVESGGFGKGSFVYATGFSASKANVKCNPSRKVKLRLTGGGNDPLTVDSATTSASGGFYLFGFNPSDYDTLTVKMKKKNIGKDGHRHICTGDSAFVDGPT